MVLCNWGQTVYNGTLQRQQSSSKPVERALSLLQGKPHPRDPVSCRRSISELPLLVASIKETQRPGGRGSTTAALASHPAQEPRERMKGLLRLAHAGGDCHRKSRLPCSTAIVPLTAAPAFQVVPSELQFGGAVKCLHRTVEGAVRQSCRSGQVGSPKCKAPYAQREPPSSVPLQLTRGLRVQPSSE